MPDVLDLLPLYPEETEEAIRDRWVAWANEGTDPSDTDRWTDVREGAHWWLSTTQGIREAARFYDLMGTEVVAAALPQYAWGEYLDDHAEVRGVARKVATYAEGEVKFTGAPATTVDAGVVVAVERANEDAPVREYAVTTGGDTDGLGVVELPVRALVAGTEGNVDADAIDQLITPVDGITAVTNEDPIVGGTDVETDLELRGRVVDAYEGPGAANRAYYRRLALDQEGVGRAAIVQTAAGEFTIIISTADGDPVASSVVDALQAKVDPDPQGEGAGEGQIGATITVATATTQAINVSGTIEFESGYSLLGGGGTVRLFEPIVERIAAYIDTVGSGEEVVQRIVLREILNVPGTHDASGITLSGAGGNGNVAVSTSPPKVPVLGTTSGIVEGTV